MENMVPMKVDHEKAEESYEEKSLAVPQMDYPYGRKICLDETSIQKLGLGELPKVGAQMKVVALCSVVSVSSYQNSEDGPQRSIDLQITDMGLGEAKSAKVSPEVLYGED